MSGIFISYRREDSGGYAGRLFDILSARVGRDHTYMDLDTIQGGDNFPAVIEEKVGQCDVLLALIGERWLTITGEDGSRRLDQPGDFVRLEIAKALQRNVRVIPVLVGGAAMPRENDLPADLRALAEHQAMDLRDAHFHADADLLIGLLDKTVPGIGNRPWPLASPRFVSTIAIVLTVVAVLGGVAVYRQTRPAPPAPPVPNVRPDAAAQIPPAAVAVASHIAGQWKATVKYDWGDVYTETFDFEVAGQELSGTASLLERGRGIFDGKIEGDRVSFTTKSQTSVGEKTFDDKQYYKGTVDGDTIRFSLVIDSGAESHVPIRFTATRPQPK